MPKVMLHRCGVDIPLLPAKWHPCAKVQEALDEQGIEYEVVKEPALPRSRRKEVERLSGQRMLPVIVFEDGAVYRAESAEMAARIRAGHLFADEGPG